MPLTANISSQMWDDVIDQSKNFDQKLARETHLDPDGEDKPIRQCLHSWVVVAEAVDAPIIDQFNKKYGLNEGSIRQDTEDSCTDGLAIPYAFALAEFASKSLPECSTLDPAHFRNLPTLLSYCNYLRGDRLAAGEAYAVVRDLNAIHSDEPTNFDRFFRYDNRLRIADFARDIANGRLSIWAPDAQDRDNAKAKGVVIFDTPDEKQFIAEIELSLERDDNGFLIADCKIGERKLMKDDD